MIHIKNLTLIDVKVLQVEATTRCNAWCSQCARSKGGHELADHITLEDLDTDRYQEILDQFLKIYQNL